MLSEVGSKQLGTLAYQDFILSRQSMQCTKATMQFYRYTAGQSSRIIYPFTASTRSVKGWSFQVFEACYVFHLYRTLVILLLHAAPAGH